MTLEEAAREILKCNDEIQELQKEKLPEEEHQERLRHILNAYGNALIEMKMALEMKQPGVDFKGVILGSMEAVENL